MKKIIILILCLIILSACGKNIFTDKEFIFNKNKECLEIYDSKDSEDFINSFSYGGIDDNEIIISKLNVKNVFYSPSENSCLFTFSEISSQDNDGNTVTYSKNYAIIDLINREIIFKTQVARIYEYVLIDIDFSAITDLEKNLYTQVRDQQGNHDEGIQVVNEYREYLGEEKYIESFKEHIRTNIEDKELQEEIFNAFDRYLIYNSAIEAKSSIVKQINNHIFEKSIQNKKFEKLFQNDEEVLNSEIIFEEKISELKN